MLPSIPVRHVAFSSPGISKSSPSASFSGIIIVTGHSCISSRILSGTATQNTANNAGQYAGAWIPEKDADSDDLEIPGDENATCRTGIEGSIQLNRI